MAPVLLDHRSQTILGVSVVLALFVVFLSGYVAGFKKAEFRLDNPIETVALELPMTVAEASVTDIEPQLPLLIEPGEKIDVDSADEVQITKSSGIIKTAHASQRSVKEKSPQSVMQKIDKQPQPQAKAVKPVDNAQAEEAVVSRPLAMGGPAATDPGQAAVSLIQNTATEDNAAFSIQVGMYGRLENAERRVEELIATDLSGYLSEYLNKREQIRYNVRFGYFADRRSARQALATYENEMSGSGYIIRLQPSASASISTNSSTGG